MKIPLFHFLLIALLCLGHHFLPAQNIQTQVTQYLQQLQQQQAVSPPALPVLKEDEAKQLLITLSAYRTDSLQEVRQAAYVFTHELGLRTGSIVVKTQAVGQLMRGLQDNDPGLQQWVAGKLKQYPKSSFNQESKDLLEQAIRQQKATLAALVLVAGYLELMPIAPFMMHLLQFQSATLNVIEKWNLHLALARMGEPKAIAYCVRKVEQFPVNDEVVYELLPGLAYIRQPESFAYLQEQLWNEDQNCSVADPESSGQISCAYRILELITPYIQDFPIQLSAGGDVETQDYTAALHAAKEWLTAHPDYQLKRDIY